LADLVDVWREHGRADMEAMAKRKDGTFTAVCSRLIPSEVRATVEQTFAGLDAADMAILAAIKESIPDANARSPAEVLEFVKEAVQAHSARALIEAKPSVR
jgi:hypothetical protein